MLRTWLAKAMAVLFLFVANDLYNKKLVGLFRTLRASRGMNALDGGAGDHDPGVRPDTCRALGLSSMRFAHLTVMSERAGFVAMCDARRLQEQEMRKRGVAGGIR